MDRLKTVILERLGNIEKERKGKEIKEIKKKQTKEKEWIKENSEKITNKYYSIR